MRRIAIISIILLHSCLVFSQDNTSFEAPTKFLELGISANSYRGDLNANFDKYAIGIHAALKYNRKKRINGKLSLMYGMINGQNVNYPAALSETPNTFFTTTMLTFHYELHVNIIKKERYGVYLSQGIGLMRFNPKDENYENLSDQFDTRPDGESYSPVTLMLPTSLGGYYLLKNGYGIGLQLQYLNSRSDYLDNISQWGFRKKKDNVFLTKFTIYIPLKFGENTPQELPEAK